MQSYKFFLGKKKKGGENRRKEKRRDRERERETQRGGKERKMRARE